MPNVIRAALPHVEAIRPAIAAQVRRYLKAADWDASRDGFAGLVRKRTTQHVNELTALIVQSLYPTWGRDVNGAFVGRVKTDDTKNAKRRRQTTT